VWPTKDADDGSVADAYTTEDIKYEWKSENPIQQKDGLRQSLVGAPPK
jgi:hypothetical protein